MRSEKRHYRIGEIAKLIGCAPRTVQSWFDAGLLGGFRLPAASPLKPADRRIDHASFVAFSRKHGLQHVLEVIDPVRLLVVAGAQDVTGPGVIHAESLFETGLLAWQAEALILDCCLGRREVLLVGRRVAALGPRPRLVAIVYEDDPDSGEFRASGFDVVLQRPVDPARILAAALAKKEPRA